MSPHGEETIAQMVPNMDDELMQDSRAAFGVYRPEIRHIPDPLTYKEAKRKYRMQADTNLDDHSRRMKKLSTYKAMVKAGPYERTSNQIVPGGEIGKYLGHRGEYSRGRSKMSHTQKGSMNGMDRNGTIHGGVDMAPVVHSIDMTRQNINHTQISHRVDFPPVKVETRRKSGRGFSQQSERAVTSLR